MSPTVLSVDVECSVSVGQGLTVPITASRASGRTKHSINTLVSCELRYGTCTCSFFEIWPPTEPSDSAATDPAGRRGRRAERLAQHAPSHRWARALLHGHVNMVVVCGRGEASSAPASSRKWAHLIAPTCEHGQRAHSSVQWWPRRCGRGCSLVEIGFESEQGWKKSSMSSFITGVCV